MRGQPIFSSVVDKKETLDVAPGAYSYFPTPAPEEGCFPCPGPSFGWVWLAIGVLLIILLGHSQLAAAAPHFGSLACSSQRNTGGLSRAVELLGSKVPCTRGQGLSALAVQPSLYTRLPQIHPETGLFFTGSSHLRFFGQKQSLPDTVYLSPLTLGLIA